MSKASGKIERRVSSNNKVKSKPPRHCSAYGPNESSMSSQKSDDMAAFAMTCLFTLRAA